MREINCYIPIKLRIVGELSDAQLGELARAVQSAVQSRMAFAQRTLAARTHVQHAQPESPMVPVVPFETVRWTPKAETYTIPSYKDGGKPSKIKIDTKGKKSQKFTLTDDIQKALENQIKEKHLSISRIDLTSYKISWQLDKLQRELTEWTYITFFIPDKPPKEAERNKIFKEIEKSIVTPVLLEYFRNYYTFAFGVSKNMPMPPEIEYAALPDEVQRVVEGGFKGWLAMRDQIAASLAPDMRQNLVLFYGWAPEGKMAKIRIWSDLEKEAVVHEDLVHELNQVADELTKLAPLLRQKYLPFWEKRSALGLQIRPIAGTSTLSAHAVGKAIDVAAKFNPHLKDPRLLSEIESEASVEKKKDLELRHRLLIQQREALAKGEEMSEEFKKLLQRAMDTYQQWIRAQKVFQEVFPTVHMEDDPATVLKEIIERIEAKHVQATKKLGVVKLALENAKRTIQSLEAEQQQLKVRAQGLHKSLLEIAQQIRRLKKHPPAAQETKSPSEHPMTAEDAEKRRALIIEEEKLVQTRLKVLPSLLKDGRRAVAEAEGDLKKTAEEEALLGKMSHDLVSDKQLLFRTGVIDPGLATIKERGFLNVPWEVVEVFLKHGFDWGGLWTHPDFMHFEWAGLVSGEEPHKKKK